MHKTLRLFPTAVFILYVSLTVLAEHITVQGEVSGEWNVDTVFVAGDLLVPDGQNLVIAPGSRVVFQGVYEFQVDGSLRAIGLLADSIYFTMADTTGFHIDTIPGGGWGGVRFDKTRASNDSSIFDYCRFEYGKIASNDPAKGHGGALFINDFDKVRISNCCFRENFATYNGGAIYLDSANVSINNTLFTLNRAGLSVAPWGYGGAVCSDNSIPQIYWNVFENNSSTGVGGGLAVRFIDCPVYNNVFTGNYSALGGGFGFLHIPECTHRINTNLIAENASAFFGGGVANLNASPIYVNNTIANNQSTYGGGFYCKDSVSPDFYNTIIWGNTAAVGSQGYLFEVYSQADFFYCDVQDGPEMFGGSGGGAAFLGAYESCINEDPLFQGLSPHPYVLHGDSPCVDAGSTDTTGFFLPETDLAYNPRIWPATIDMGAYEFFLEGTDGPAQETDLILFPNPTTGQFKVQSAKFKVEWNSVEVYSLNGQLVEYWNLEPGTRNPEFDISNLPDGLYLIRVNQLNEVTALRISKISR